MKKPPVVYKDKKPKTPKPIAQKFLSNPVKFRHFR